MAEPIEFETKEEAKSNVVFKGVRTLYLMSLGATAMAVDFAKDTQSNVADFSHKLVERGEEADKKTREVVTSQTEHRQKDVQKAVQDTTKKVNTEVEKRFEGLLHTMNVPSRNDIDKLSNKVTRLNRKVNELSKAA
jgi:poly(hydroxyalkanoate) granule-associated protein